MRTKTKMNLVQAINTLVDYNWDDEQTHWEECNEGKEYPADEPDENDDHVFSNLVRIEKFLNREVEVYGKKTNINCILQKMTDDEVYKILADYAEQSAQERGL